MLAIYYIKRHNIENSYPQMYSQAHVQLASLRCTFPQTILLRLDLDHNCINFLTCVFAIRILTLILQSMEEESRR